MVRLQGAAVAAFGNWTLQWCPLRAADLPEADLPEADLPEADLPKADLPKTSPGGPLSSAA